MVHGGYPLPGENDPTQFDGTFSDATVEKILGDDPSSSSRRVFQTAIDFMLEESFVLSVEKGIPSVVGSNEGKTVQHSSSRNIDFKIQARPFLEGYVKGQQPPFDDREISALYGLIYALNVTQDLDYAYRNTKS